MLPLNGLRTFVTIVVMALAVEAHTQGSFTELFGGPLAHDGIGVVECPSGWKVGVRAYSGVTEGHKALLARRNSAGQAVQETTLDLPGRAFIQAMAPAQGGGSYICGSLLPSGGAHQGLLLRLTPSGSLLWQRTLPSTIGIQFLALTTLGDGSVAVCGMAEGAQGHDVAVARYASDGTLLWSDIEAFDLDAEAHGIAANDQGIMVTGRQQNYGGKSDAFFLYYSLDGSLQMSTSWGGIEDEEGRAITTTPDGNFVMAGTTRSYGPADAQGRRRSNLHLIKINAAGDTLWTRSYGDLLRDRRVLAMDVSSNGELLIAGSSMGAGIQYNDEEAWVARISANGNLLWERNYAQGSSAGLRGIRALSSGFVACGWSFGTTGRRALLLRRDGSGQ